MSAANGYSQAPPAPPLQQQQPPPVFPSGVVPALAGYPPAGHPMQAQLVPQQNQHLLGPAAKLWAEHAMPDGRRYFYHLPTGKSVWEKPDDLKTEAELILARCAWKEFRTQAGKIYYSHSETRESSWTKPEELANAERMAEMANQRAAAAAAIEPLRQMQQQGAPAQPPPPPPPTSGSSAIEEAMKKTLESFGVLPPAGTASPQQQQPAPTGPAAQPPKKTKQQRMRDLSDVEDSSSSGSSDGSGSEASKKSWSAKKPKREQNMEEVFKELLKDRRVPSSATWETAVRLIQEDPRYQRVKQLQNRRQVFNNYKTQRQKEEKEEQRLKVKKAREDLEQFLLHTSRLASTVKYRNAEKLYAELRVWTAVPERDRRDIFEDAIKEIEKREREEQRSLQRRNIERFGEILGGMREMSYLTTWTEAQQLLSHSETFRADTELLEMDKEDALICFQKHIMRLEKEEDDKKEEVRLRQRRQERKHREAFVVLLGELNSKGKLSANSMWKDCFRDICRDHRFDQMLSQPGSTPLDLFKFFVDDLKRRFPEEKRVVKEIIKDRAFSIGPETQLDDFMRVIAADERGRALDPGNVERSFHSLLEKALCIEQERRTEERRRLERHADAFKELLFSADPPVDAATGWDAIKERFGHTDSFLAIPLESERLIVFKDYLKCLAESAAGGGGAGPDASAAVKKKKRDKKKKAKGSHKEREKDNRDYKDKEKDKDYKDKDYKDKDYKDRENKDKEKDSRDYRDKEKDRDYKDKERDKDYRDKEKDRDHRDKDKGKDYKDKDYNDKDEQVPVKKERKKKAKKEKKKKEHKKHHHKKDKAADSGSARKRKLEDSAGSEDGKRMKRASNDSSASSGAVVVPRSGGAAGPDAAGGAEARDDSMDLSEGELEKERERLIAQLHD